MTQLGGDIPDGIQTIRTAVTRLCQEADYDVIDARARDWTREQRTALSDLRQRSDGGPRRRGDVRGREVFAGPARYPILPSFRGILICSNSHTPTTRWRRTLASYRGNFVCSSSYIRTTARGSGRAAPGP